LAIATIMETQNNVGRFVIASCVNTWSAVQRIATCIIILNNPKVSHIRGVEISFKIGLKKALRRARTKAAIINIVRPPCRMKPGKYLVAI